MSQKIKKGLLILAVMLLAGRMNYFEWLYYPDSFVTDKLYQRPASMNPKIKIIAIDEKTLQSLGAFGTWDRSVYADLLDRLYNQGGPALTVFDIIFSERLTEKGDAAFAKACKEAETVVTATDLVNKEKIVKYGQESAYLDKLYVENVLPPYQELMEVTQQGFVEAAVDKDGYIRHAYWQMRYGSEVLPSLGQTVYREYAKQQNMPVQPPGLDQYGRFGFAYSGNPGDYDHISMLDVLAGTVDPRLFTNCIVFVGAYADGLRDNYSAAVSRSGRQMYGVEVQANIVQALLEGQTNQPADPRVMVLIVALLVGVYLYIISRCRIRGTIITTVTAIAADLLGGLFLFRSGYTALVLTLPVLALVCCVMKIISTYLSEVVKRKRIMQTFKRYVAPQVVDEVVGKQAFSVNLTGETKDIAVLFVDIRSFTSLSENMVPHEVVQMLNYYLNLVTQAIYNQEGTVDKFIGDAAMAVFNAPFDLEDYEYKAVCTGLEIVEKSKELDAYTRSEFGKNVECGVGIHCGTAIVGNIGSEMRLDYTAIGDTVNTASRIEGKAKGGQVLISQAMKERLEGRIEVKEAGPAELKGKKTVVMLYEVTAIKGDQM